MLSLLSSPLNKKIIFVIFRVVVIWPRTPDIHVQQTAQSGAVFSGSQRLCKSVHEMENCTFREHANMHLILREARGDGAAAVMLCSDFRATHFSCQRWSHQGERYCSLFCGRPRKTEKCTTSCCGRAHVQTHVIELPYQRSPNTSCWKCGAEDRVAGPAWIVAVPIQFSKCTCSKVCLIFAHAKNFANGSYVRMVKVPSLAAV
jgi:hypothetical protein